MKRFLLLLFFMTALCLTGAQAMFWPYMPWCDDYNDRYYVPSAITANEYQAFLMERAQTDGWLGGLQYYWDSKYMDPKSPDYCIIRTGTWDNYHYAVKEGCGNKKIFYVASYEIAQEISTWKENPTIGELLKYMSTMAQAYHLQQEGKPYAAYWNEAQHIRQRYPYVKKNSDVNDPDFGKDIFNHAEGIAKTMRQPQPDSYVPLPNDHKVTSSYVLSAYILLGITYHHHILLFTTSNFYTSHEICCPFPKDACPFSEMMIRSLITYERDETLYNTAAKNEPWMEYARPTSLAASWMQ